MWQDKFRTIKREGGRVMLKNLVKYFVALFAAVLVLLNPQSSLEYARQGLLLCEEVLVPSLFPFFVCSGLLIHSGVCEWLSKVFAPVMKPFFNVGGSGAAAFILGIISGYPLGAQVSVRLFEEGALGKNETERLLAFCNNSGPLFLLGSVGAAIYHSPKLGMILYGAHIAAALTVGIIFRFYKRGSVANMLQKTDKKEMGMAEIFQHSLSGSVTSILGVCGAVIFFSVIANLLADFLPNGIMRTLFIAASELTSGINGISTSNIPLAHKAVLSAMAAGFAGFCVHLQVMSVAAGRGLSLIPYIVGKVFHALFAGLYTFLLLKLYPITVTVFSAQGDISGSFFAASVFTGISAVVIVIIAGVGVGVKAVIKRNKKSLPLEGKNYS